MDKPFNQPLWFGTAHKHLARYCSCPLVCSVNEQGRRKVYLFSLLQQLQIVHSPSMLRHQCSCLFNNSDCFLKLCNSAHGNFLVCIILSCWYYWGYAQNKMLQDDDFKPEKSLLVKDEGRYFFFKLTSSKAWRSFWVEQIAVTSHALLSNSNKIPRVLDITAKMVRSQISWTLV